MFDLLKAYQRGEIASLWEADKKIVMDNLPLYNHVRCGDIAAARIAVRAGEEMEALEAKVNPFSMTDEEVELYDWLAEKYDLKADLQKLSGSRTLITDMQDVNQGYYI